MAEDTQMAEEQPVSDTQDSPMPSEEQQTAAVEQPDGLPEDAKERTKKVVEEALQKAKTYEEQLREERTRRQYYESLIQQPKPTPQMIDPFTGLVDESALLTLQQQTQEALRVANEAKQRNLEYQRDQENNAVYSVHPELKPDAKEFNKDLHNLTRSYLLDSMVNPDSYNGKELSFMEAAEKAKKTLGAQVQEAKKQGATEAIEQLTPKEQASLGTVDSARRGDSESIDELRLRSRGRDETAKLARIERFNRMTKQG